ncbi:MAG: radical SAM family heme chaperone HemW [Firmicutes bacterium]|nr:radical SAM family heme chaperone HemW [Bacillota bacterium]
MSSKALAVYVHIPYCARKCAYCDFNSYDRFGEDQVERYLRALEREMELASGHPDVAGRPVTSVFVGGGTPTILSGEQLAGLLHRLGQLFPLAAGAEVTSEANPGTVDRAKLETMREAGFNRLSLGAQALQDRLLERLGRIHRAGEVEESVTAARQAGFTNINLDLMYGLPEQTPADWEETLRWALGLHPEHVSAYSLIVEAGTPFAALHQRGLLPLPDEDLEAAMDETALAWLADAGYEAYEVSNYARDGFRCRHNQVYWHNEEYLGLGAGAFGYLAGERCWNLRRPQDYASALLTEDRLPGEGSERPDRATSMGETMMLGLRLTEGVELERFRRRYGQDLTEVYADPVARLVGLRLLDRTPERLRLTPRGRQVGNRVFAEFLPAQ